MIWAPSGPTVVSGTSATQFVPTGQTGGGVARVINMGAAATTFSIGSSGVTNTQLIPLPVNSEMYIAYGSQTHVIAAAATSINITPGVGRI